MGAHQTDNASSTEPGLSFLFGAETVHVLVLEPADLAHRNAIIDAVLSLSTLRNQYRLVYLAAPRILGATIDAAAFRSRGIGLLFFDERRIDEAVAPQAMQLPTLPAAMPPEDTVVSSELATLKSMYLEMQRTLNQLRDDLTGLQHAPLTQDDLPRTPEPVRVVAAQPIFAHGVTQGEGLPSYFANNPWLEVLSKRSNGEHEAIAG
jgi:hypothetical protein